LLALGRAAEAEPLLVRALESLRSAFPDDHSHVRSTVAALVEAYRALGRPEDAERYAALGR
jgi:lipopolysaccharide biosynthesis regulator YciM